VAQQPNSGLGRRITQFSRSLTDIPHAVGLLWTRDRPVAETCTWLLSQDTDIHVPGGIRTRHPSERTAADLAATGSATTPTSLTKFALTIPSTVSSSLALLIDLLDYALWQTTCKHYDHCLK